MALRNWRTLPGQGNRWQSSMASGEIRLRRRLCLAVNCSKKLLDQERDVFRPLAQRGHGDGHNLQAVEQVLAELARCHGLVADVYWWRR